VILRDPSLAKPYSQGCVIPRPGCRPECGLAKSKSNLTAPTRAQPSAIGPVAVSRGSLKGCLGEPRLLSGDTAQLMVTAPCNALPGSSKGPIGPLLCVRCAAVYNDDARFLRHTPRLTYLQFTVAPACLLSTAPHLSCLSCGCPPEGSFFDLTVVPTVHNGSALESLHEARGDKAYRSGWLDPRGLGPGLHGGSSGDHVLYNHGEHEKGCPAPQVDSDRSTRSAPPMTNTATNDQQLLLGLWHGTFIFNHAPVYGWYLSVTAIGLNMSWSLHNVIAWIKNKPFLSHRVSMIYIITVILVQPYWVLEIYANFTYFNNVNTIFLHTRPFEALCRDPWWIFTTISLFWNIKNRYDFGFVEIIRISPRFGVMLGAMCLSIAFLILDILSVTGVISSGLPVGVNPFWKVICHHPSSYHHAKSDDSYHSSSSV
jgi:hypothetical protein